MARAGRNVGVAIWPQHEREIRLSGQAVGTSWAPRCSEIRVSHMARTLHTRSRLSGRAPGGASAKWPQAVGHGRAAAQGRSTSTHARSAAGSLPLRCAALLRNSSPRFEPYEPLIEAYVFARTSLRAECGRIAHHCERLACTRIERIVVIRDRRAVAILQSKVVRVCDPRAFHGIRL